MIVATSLFQVCPIISIEKKVKKKEYKSDMRSIIAIVG
jgi:hypothetical protein